MPLSPHGSPDVESADNPTRARILAATAEVLGRSGTAKLSLSEVAAQAGVSRPTLYRYFADKRELLDAFVVWERQLYEHAVAAATAGLPAGERLDAALRVIVEYQLSYPGLRMVDVEPEQVIRRLARVLPLMRDRLQRLCTGPDATLAAATAVRVAVSQYLVRSDDSAEFLDQLRHAARVRHQSP
ncbi:TetR/AcrR family transcriptional regulator [Mycolicibacterium vaccae]|uniref:TetR/AcrR family transcriptional regulator n=1 Tax=Mycolicibacterium vaccae TaxID=1810 RepID=UPI003CFC4630